MFPDKEPPLHLTPDFFFADFFLPVQMSYRVVQSIDRFDLSVELILN
jgi:hypothetical protein